MKASLYGFEMVAFSLHPLDPVSTPSDLDLVAALNRGDVAAFDALYARHRDWVVRLARRFCGNDADALDVLQDTFAYLLRKFPGFRLTASMTTFLYPVVKHLALAAKRKSHRLAGADEATLNALPDESLADPANSRPELSAVLAALPETHREVLLMRFVDGLSLAEIAEALEIPVGTVKSRLHNALATLKADPRARAYFGAEAQEGDAGKQKAPSKDGRPPPSPPGLTARHFFGGVGEGG